VCWEYPGPDHLPPADEPGQREGLKGFLQSDADNPHDSREWIDPRINEGAHTAVLECKPEYFLREFQDAA